LRNRIEVLSTNIRNNANAISEMLKQDDYDSALTCMTDISVLAIKIIDELNNSNTVG